MTNQGRSLFAMSILISSVFLLSACTFFGKNAPAPSPTPAALPATGDTQKSGTTTATGVLTVTGKTAILKTKDTTVPVESYAIKFDEYNGKEVTITGKFSGDTLFASKITAADQAPEAEAPSN